MPASRSHTRCLPGGCTQAWGLQPDIVTIGLLLDPEKGDSTSGLAVDSGLVAELGAGLMIGVTAHNLLPDNGTEETNARSWGAGVGYESRWFTLATDVVYEPSVSEDLPGRRFRYHAGAEYLAGENLPVRLGWMWRADEGTGSQHLAFGLGWITRTGALDFAYRQRLDGGGDRSFALGLRSFF